MLRWLFQAFRTNAPQEPEPEDEIEYLTRAEAEDIARTEAIRDLQFAPQSISYVAYHEPFADYCRITIEFDEPNRGEYHLQLLPLDERLEDETYDDNKIKAIARSGNLLNAVRLYRHLHSASLMVAKSAVERMRDEV